MSHMTREEWFSLPLTFRQRWWRETDFDKRAPPPDLEAEARRLIEQTKNGGEQH